MTTTVILDRRNLHGTPLWLSRTAWIVITVALAIFFVVALPARFNELRIVYPDHAPTVWQLTPPDAEAMQTFGVTPDGYAYFITGLALLFAVFFLTTAVIIFARRSDERVAMLVTLNLVVYGITNYFVLDALVNIQPGWQFAVNLVNGLSVGILPLTMCIFPNEKFFPRWVRPIVIFWAVWMLAFSFFPDTVLNLYKWPRGLFVLVILIFVGGGIAAQTYRFRNLATPTERQQTKWILFGIVAGLIGFLVSQAPQAIFPSLTVPGSAHVLYAILSTLIFTVFNLIVPITFAVSILRYRLFDVDLLINRGLVYGALTVLLGLIFFGATVLLTSVLGQQQSLITIVLGALIIGALFQPARQRLQQLVDRRIYHVNKFSDTTAQTLINTNDPYVHMRFGGYVVTEPLGKGGMATVYKGRHLTLNRVVAIKVLSGDKANNPNFRARFEREAQTVAALRHPNIVQMYDFGNVGGTYYMAMEFISGQNLDDYLLRERRLTLDEALPILRDLAAALDYAHRNGVIHRDVKPSNIMLQPNTSVNGVITYNAVLMDFGIAKVLQDGSQLTQTGTVGTLNYMAPEQITSAREVTGLADVHAVGIIAYQMLTGQMPFQAESIGAQVYATIHNPPTDPRQTLPTLPEYVAKAILKALAKNPDERYPTVGEFVSALQGG